jgi:hypothetical protein
MKSNDVESPIVRVLDSAWRTLAFGTHDDILGWLSRNPEAPSKMISIGQDHQILSVSEYKSLYGNGKTS